MLGDSSFLDYYRLPEQYPGLRPDPLTSGPGFFNFHGTTLYGRTNSACAQGKDFPVLYEKANATGVQLPFDADEVVENLRLERYIQQGTRTARARSVGRCIYYALRGCMPASLRKHLQRLAARGWQQKVSPQWPVDCSVDDLMLHLLSLIPSEQEDSSVPFIWFWPDGCSSAAIITHDVETASGRDFSTQLMDIDESFGFKSSFQVVPETRYCVSSDWLDTIRSRHFEVAIHDLRHDGRLFNDHAQFVKNAATINAHGRRFGAVGFRSAVLYRNPDWLSELDFIYDMSFPNVAPLDPQPGGCCTVMPFHIGKMVELPLTTMQDYTLFNLLGSYSIGIWQKQIEMILQHHGLISILVHPDYLLNSPAVHCYCTLLAFLREQGMAHKIWFALPHEVAQWWRQRAHMSLVKEGGEWKIVGDGSSRALIAYAARSGDGVSLEPPGLQPELRGVADA